VNALHFVHSTPNTPECMNSFTLALHFLCLPFMTLMQLQHLNITNSSPNSIFSAFFELHFGQLLRTISTSSFLIWSLVKCFSFASSFFTSASEMPINLANSLVFFSFSFSRSLFILYY